MELVTPAQLKFLAIYNPDLGPTDENLPEQLVYYHSGKGQDVKSVDKDVSQEDRAREELNEQLRNVGLAQGIVNFGKAFTDTEDVDFVDSEKSRIFMRELEPGWWVLGSISLTHIRTTVTTKTGKGKGKVETKVKDEYSGREVGPHGLLLQQILSAHSIFLLHHGSSLAELYTRIKRPKFCAALDRFWSQFLKDWDVLLHGTPAIDMFPGIKLAAGGELGFGVGEEDWGSGEREVLEDFTHRTDGLIDVVVSHFEGSRQRTKEDSDQKWLGAGNPPTSSDGIIYSGTGNITRKSLAHISKWMQWMYKYGASTYGIQDNPHAPKRRRKRKQSSKPQSRGLDAWPTGIPPPLIGAANQSLEQASLKAEARLAKGKAKEAEANSKPTSDVLMKYMTFGLYGSGWGLPTGNSLEHSKAPARTGEIESKAATIEVNQEGSKTNEAKETKTGENLSLQSKPYFLVGLQGSLEDDGENISEDDSDPNSDGAGTSKSWNSRIFLRTLYIERQKQSSDKDDNSDNDSRPTKHFDRAQVIVYVNRPFVFTFLFELNTPTLSYVSFYKSIHHQLGPLRKPLMRSTSPEIIHNRLFEVVSPRTISSADNKQPIYDLIYDPTNFTVHTTIPPIPDANDITAEWSRLDALNVHSQIVSTQLATRTHLSEIERTAKTTRGWWVVWLKFPPGDHKHSKEAFLVRKASDYVDESGRKGSLGFGKDIANWSSNAGKVAEGIGIDARRYVEGLISLSR